MRQVAWLGPRMGGRVAVAGAVVGLLLLLVTGEVGGKPAQPAWSQATGTAVMAGMAGTPATVPAWANSMRVQILSPASGSKLSANQLTLHLSFSGYTPSCAGPGTPVSPGHGQYHILVDRSLASLFCASAPTISMQGLRPGRHQVTVVPALSDHTEVGQNARSIAIDYQPAQPLPAVTPAPAGRLPTIKILSPATGATPSGAFTMRVSVQGLHLSCHLRGRPPVSGYGEWRVYHDTTRGMNTMMAMPCTETATLSTLGLPAGRHTLYANLADSQHNPVPAQIADKVTIDVS